ncbi:MAG: hypothetical protein RLZZ188_1907 [Verrucomicrobiota bacterium]|jgi:putative endonuclease
MTSLLQRILAFLGRAPRGTGAVAEEEAARWLERERGFRVVARNWRNPADRREEIDLVARDGEILVFVEVKSRARGALVPGYHAVDRRKKAVLRRAITAYLRALGPPPRTFRLDIVEVTPPAAGAGVPEVLHFENIPLFPKHFRP